jgi:glycosyltransferase involved in cell wall biosynthesis
VTYSIYTVLQLFAWFIALLWFWKAITTAFGLRRVPNLIEPKYDLHPAGNPSLTVIVPARNEAEKVAACLQSLLDQQYSNLHILAVNDRSTDSTGTIMDALALQHPDKLTVLHITELPVGWLGKTHAMALAANHAIALHHPSYLLFTDADVLFHPNALRLALAQAISTQADHFILLPTLLIKSAGEGMLISYLQIIGLWAVRTWRVSDPKALRDAVGVGAFNLLRTSAYQQIGGYEALRMQIVEDLELGRRVKQDGLRQRVASGPGLISLHWATGISGIINGVTKNFFAIFHYNPAVVLLSCLWIAAFCIAPAILLALPETRTPAILTFTSVALLYVLSSRQSRVSPVYAFFFPISAALIAYSILRSTITTLKQGGVTWRGTFYPLSELRKTTNSPR